MRRLLSGAADGLLVVTPPMMLYGMTVPVPQYRTGTFADYQAFVVSCLTIYGGVVHGIAVRWWRSEHGPAISTAASFGLASRAGSLRSVSHWRSHLCGVASEICGDLSSFWGVCLPRP
jgi:hypothetical protein